jgi:hypothetical protein
MFYGHDRLVKVNLSMARLLTIVNERKKLRAEYRHILEDRYIAKKKEEEQAQLEEERARLMEEGESVEMT